MCLRWPLGKRFLLALLDLVVALTLSVIVLLRSVYEDRQGNMHTVLAPEIL
jgi:hypothetical protein